jgi:hypothetical protein
MVCSQYLAMQGQPYPKTCVECGLGPCWSSFEEGIEMLEQDNKPEQVQESINVLDNASQSDPKIVADKLSNEALHSILIAKFGSLEQAAREIKYDAEKPEMEKLYQEYKNKESWKTGIVGNTVKFRTDDHNALGLFFSVWTSEGSAFGAYIPIEEMRKVVEDTGITEFTKLGGLPCYYTEENGFCRFKGFWKGKRD